MLYFDVVWPPRITDQTLSEMTMSKLAAQMDEFLSEVVIEDEPVRYDLEICEEYQKE